MRILITGSNGLLGQKLILLCQKFGYEYLATSQGENRFSACPEKKYLSLDITSQNEVDKVILKYLPSHIIHTAAMTNVDACEEDPISCHKVNVLGTHNLLKVAQKASIHLCLLSTDFVFDGKKGDYKETDEVNPLSVYSKSKVDAENLLINSHFTNWSIARTIIVFGTGENLSRSNIVLWAREALAKGGPLSIVDDQFRSPTWATDLAWGCLSIAQNNQKGIFHLSGPKKYSIIELVRAIAKYYNYSTEKITAVDSSTLNQKAKRPPNTGFDLTKSGKFLQYDPMTLEESLIKLDKELK
jgi:dTDP-4-dehydrorhamnose reductase